MTGTTGRIPPKSIRLATLSLMAIALPQAAMAQEATPAAPAPAAAEPTSGLTDIVVTARRRSENLQDVPVAITALTGAALQSRNITGVSALDGLAPNVKVVESGSNTTTYIQIRGSVTTNPNPGYDPAAAMYIDGVYIGKAVGSTIDVADIDHIEVLRGPQGTLFGRNTLSGAINIVTKKPSGELGGMVKLGVGDYGRWRGQFSLDLPEFHRFSVKVSGLIARRDGYIKVEDNPYPQIPAPARTVDRLGDERSEALRAAVRFQPTDDLSFDYAFDYNNIHNTPAQGVLSAVGAGGIFDPSSPAYIGVPLYLYVQDGKRPDVSWPAGGVDNRELYEKVKAYNHAFTASWDVSDALALKSITAYRQMDWSQSLDLDGSPLPLAAAGSDLDYHQFSQELQATGKVGRLNYTGGFYYFNDKGDSTNPQQFFGTTLTSDSIFKTNAYAFYGQLDWRPPVLDDKLVLTAGYRYSHEKKSTERYADAGGYVTIPRGTYAEATFTGSTPTFVAKYEFSRDFNIYGKYSEGFKSGGFSVDATDLYAATTPYRPEKVKSIEVGAKARLLDGRLRMGVAAFFDKHDDQQIQIFTPTQAGFVVLTANGAKSKIKGFEFEAQANPVDWLVMSGNVGFTHARFTEYYGVTGGPNTADTQAFAFVPRWTASGTIDARVFERDWMETHVAFDITHSSGYAALPYSTDPAVNPNIYSTYADPATVIDGRVTFGKIPVAGADLEATVFVRNIFNDASRTAGIDFGQSFGNIVTRNWNWPRTFGVDATLRF